MVVPRRRKLTSARSNQTVAGFVDVAQVTRLNGQIETRRFAGRDVTRLNPHNARRAPPLASVMSGRQNCATQHKFRCKCGDDHESLFASNPMHRRHLLNYRSNHLSTDSLTLSTRSPAASRTVWTIPDGQWISTNFARLSAPRPKCTGP